MPSQPVGVLPPGSVPSYRCAKEQDLLDATFVKKVDRLVFAQDEVGPMVVGGGADAYMASSDVVHLKGVGPKLAHVLKSRMFGIQTIQDLAKYPSDFGHRIARLPKRQVEVLSALRAGLNACKMPDRPLGRMISVLENDANMTASVTPGKEVIQHNAGRDGAAEVVIEGDPSNNGFVPSFLRIGLSGYAARGRGGHEIRFAPFSVSVSASESTRETADRMIAALQERGLSAEAMPLPEYHMGLPRHPIKISIWSDLVID